MVTLISRRCEMIIHAFHIWIVASTQFLHAKYVYSIRYHLYRSKPKFSIYNFVFCFLQHTFEICCCFPINSSDLTLNLSLLDTNLLAFSTSPRNWPSIRCSSFLNASMVARLCSSNPMPFIDYYKANSNGVDVSSLTANSVGGPQTRFDILEFVVQVSDQYPLVSFAAMAINTNTVAVDFDRTAMVSWEGLQLCVERGWRCQVTRRWVLNGTTDGVWLDDEDDDEVNRCAQHSQVVWDDEISVRGCCVVCRLCAGFWTKECVVSDGRWYGTSWEMT